MDRRAAPRGRQRARPRPLAPVCPPRRHVRRALPLGREDDRDVQGAAARLRRRTAQGRRARRLLRRQLPGGGSADPERLAVPEGSLRPPLPRLVDRRRVRRVDPGRLRTGGLRPAMKLVTYDDGRVGYVDREEIVRLGVPTMREWFERGGADETGERTPLRGGEVGAPLGPKKFFT